MATAIEINWSTPPEVVHAAALGIGYDKPTRLDALRMAGVSRADLEAALADPDAEVAAAAMSNSRAAVLIPRALRHPDPLVRAAAAANQNIGGLSPATCSEACIAASRDPDVSVQRAIAGNIGVPEIVLTQLSRQSPHADVRSMATKTLAGTLRSSGSAVFAPTPQAQAPAPPPPLPVAEQLVARGELSMFGTNIEGIVIGDGTVEAQKMEARAHTIEGGRYVVADLFMSEELRELIEDTRPGGPLSLAADFSGLTEKEIDLAFSSAALEVTQQSPFVAPSPTAAQVEGPRSPMMSAAVSFALAPLLGFEEAAGLAGNVHTRAEQENRQALNEAQRMDEARRRKLHALGVRLYEMAGKGDSSVLLYDEAAHPVSELDGKSPLHRLAEVGNVDVVHHPLAHLIEDVFGNTPLHYSAGAGVRAAVLHPEAVNVRNKAGMTPIDVFRANAERRTEAAIYTPEQLGQAGPFEELSPEEKARFNPPPAPKVPKIEKTKFISREIPPLEVEPNIGTQQVTTAMAPPAPEVAVEVPQVKLNRFVPRPIAPAPEAAPEVEEQQEEARPSYEGPSISM